MYVWVFKYFTIILLGIFGTAIPLQIDWFECYQLTPNGLVAAPSTSCSQPKPIWTP